MQPSLFNVHVPLPDRTDVFLVNTFTDAQALVSSDVIHLLQHLDRHGVDGLSPEDVAALTALQAEGFVVDNREDERRAVRERFASLAADTNELRVTVLTTLQCNFACDYCVQGDRGQPDARADRMSPATAAQTSRWIAAKLDQLRPASFVLTLFGGEPLLNLPVVYQLVEDTWRACRERHVEMAVHVITNGLLLTPEIVDRLLPFGLRGVKVTLDGTRDVHDRRRPLRGGQGTFDRIVDNVRQVAGRCRVSIGGNFDADERAFVDLLDFLANQPFAPQLGTVNFKPIIKAAPAPSRNIIPLAPIQGPTATCAHEGTACSHDDSSCGCRQRSEPVRCAPAGACDSCGLADEWTARLRDETRSRGFHTSDGVHMGPCELHLEHAYAVAPDGAIHACPGFATDRQLAMGHVARVEPGTPGAAPLSGISPWREACGDCAFVPICGGGCAVASQVELGDPSAPSCHKVAFEHAVHSLAREVLFTHARRLQ